MAHIDIDMYLCGPPGAVLQSLQGSTKATLVVEILVTESPPPTIESPHPANIGYPRCGTL